MEDEEEGDEEEATEVASRGEEEEGLGLSVSSSELVL